MEQTHREPSPEERTVDISKVVAVVRRRFWAIAIVVFLSMATTVAIVFLSKRMYAAQVILILSQPQSAGLSMGNSPVAAMFGFGGGGEGETHAQLLKSKFIVEAAAEELGLGLDIDGLDELRKNVSTKAERGSSLVVLTVKRQDPDEAATIANKIADLHSDKRSEQVRTRASQAAQYIEGQLESVQQEILETESAVRNYKVEHGIIDLPAETQGKIALLSTLETEAKKAKAERQGASSRAGQFRKSLSEQTETYIASSVIARNPLVQELEADLANLELDRAGAVANQGPEHPKVRQLDESIQKAKRELSDAVKTVVQEKVEAQNPLYLSLATQLATAEAEAMAAAAKDNALNSVLAAEYAKLSDVPEHEYRLAEMLRDERVSQEVYIALFQKYQETRLMEIMGDPGIDIVARAKPPERPESRRGAVKLMLGAITGVLLGSCLAVFLELRDKRIKPEDDIQAELGVQVLATLPRLRCPSGLVTAGEADPAYLEALRLVRTKLALRNGDKLPSPLLMVEAGANAQKTQLCLDLAAVLAQGGSRTLVVDADTRAPRLHELLGLECEQGLAETLAGVSSPTAHITPTGFPNLDALPAGSAPRDPVGLLSTPAAAAAFSAFSERYDAVVVDCPTAEQGPDYLSLARMCERTLPVIRLGVSPHPEVEAMLGNLEEMTGAPIEVVVA